MSNVTTNSSKTSPHTAPDLDTLIEVATRSYGPIISFKRGQCYYSDCTNPANLYFYRAEWKWDYLSSMCEECAKRNLHLNLVKLTSKEIFALQTFDVL